MHKRNWVDVVGLVAQWMAPLLVSLGALVAWGPGYSMMVSGVLIFAFGWLATNWEPDERGKDEDRRVS